MAGSGVAVAGDVTAGDASGSLGDMARQQPLEIVVHPDVDLQIAGYVRCDELPGRLADQTSYAQRLRRELSDVSDELVAVKAERDGLRQRVRQLEHNLGAATSADRERQIEAEVRRRLERIMRERPRLRG